MKNHMAMGKSLLIGIFIALYAANADATIIDFNWNYIVTEVSGEYMINNYQVGQEFSISGQLDNESFLVDRLNKGADNKFFTVVDIIIDTFDDYQTGYDYLTSVHGYNMSYFRSVLDYYDDNSTVSDDEEFYFWAMTETGETPYISAFIVNQVYGDGVSIEATSQNLELRYSILYLGRDPVTGNEEILGDERGTLLAVAAPVPEPTTIVLFGLGILGLAGVSRKKQ